MSRMFLMQEKIAHTLLRQAINKCGHVKVVSTLEKLLLVRGLQERFWPPSMLLTIIEPPDPGWVAETGPIVIVVQVDHCCEAKGCRSKRNLEGGDDDVFILGKDFKPDPGGFLEDQSP